MATPTEPKEDWAKAAQDDWSNAGSTPTTPSATTTSITLPTTTTTEPATNEPTANEPAKEPSGNLTGLNAALPSAQEIEELKKKAENEEAEASNQLLEMLGGLTEPKDVDLDVMVAGQQIGVNHPLYSASSFEQLAEVKPGFQPIPKDVLQGLTEGLKFTKPSRIQEKALPLLLQNPPMDLIYQAQAGTGKTAAFAIAMLSRVDPTKHYPQAVCIAHTIHLANQTMQVLKTMAQYTNIKIAAHYRLDPNDGPYGNGFLLAMGETIKEQVLVITPGKMKGYILTEKKQRGIPFDSKKINILVVDEADEILDDKVQKDKDKDVQLIRSHLIRSRKNSPDPVQVVLLSATFADHVMKFAIKFMKDPVQHNVIKLPIQEVSVENIKQYYIQVNGDDGKFEALETIYGNVSVGQTLIFVERKTAATRLKEDMEDAGHEVEVLHSGLLKKKQKEILEQYIAGDLKVLITTNILSRGIDVKAVSMVVNYDLPVICIVPGRPEADENPADPDTYLHRIGRTGRFGKTGAAISLVDVSRRRDQERINDIAQHWGREIELLDMNKENVLEKKLKEEKVAPKK